MRSANRTPVSCDVVDRFLEAAGLSERFRSDLPIENSAMSQLSGPPVPSLPPSYGAPPPQDGPVPMPMMHAPQSLAPGGPLTPEELQLAARTFLDAAEHIRHAARSTLFAAAEEESAARFQSFLRVMRFAELPDKTRLDAGWVRSALLATSGTLEVLPQRHAETGAEPIPDVLKIGLAGDLGTGMYGAPVVGASLGAREADGSSFFDYIIHLGDVYYSGDDQESIDNFLEIWPRQGAGRPISRALNGNHDMYSGGVGYFQRILPAFEQRSSYFALQNRHWVIVGLDTAYESPRPMRKEPVLGARQTSWLKRVAAQAGDRRMVLLSHHPPFSLDPEEQNRPNPFIETVLDAVGYVEIAAWYWGHEHRALVIDRHPQWGFAGRCVGHGGMPHRRDLSPALARIRFTGPHARHPLSRTFLNGSRWARQEETELLPGAWIQDDPNPFVRRYYDWADPEEYLDNGYAGLFFDERSLQEVFYRPNGTPVYRHTLVAG